jgi:class 3 adenylate cyclase
VPRASRPETRSSNRTTDGDYFGRAVNLAARLLDLAQANRPVATRQVVDQTAEPHDCTAAGTGRLMGVLTPVETFRLRLDER